MMINDKATILIVDDTAENLRILHEILSEKPYRILAFTRAKMALAVLEREKPDLILLDIMMDEMDGFEMCKKIKENHMTKDIPIIFISALNIVQDKVMAFELGGVDYITKPFQAEEVIARVKTHIKLHHLQAQLESYNNHLEEMIDQRALEVIATQRALSSALAKMTETRDYETGQHVERVQNLCQTLACHLNHEGHYPEVLNESFIRDIFYASALHDIGKVGIPDDILLKPGKLDEMEFAIIKKHVDIGAGTLEEVIQNHGTNAILNMGVDVTKYHHERWDGNGYPEGLKGNQIPLSARIMALIDVYDALRSKRPYKEGWTHETSIKLIVSEREKHFDPILVDVFIKNQAYYDEIFNRIK